MLRLLELIGRALWLLLDLGLRLIITFGTAVIAALVVAMAVVGAREGFHNLDALAHADRLSAHPHAWMVALVLTGKMLILLVAGFFSLLAVWGYFRTLPRWRIFAPWQAPAAR